MQVEFEYKRSKLNLINENKSNSSNGAARRLPKPMLACENFGRNSAPLYDRASGVRADRDVVAAAVIAAIDGTGGRRCAFAEGVTLV